MNNLPPELKYQIIIFLDTISLLRFFQTDKCNNRLNENTLWKYKCKIDYNFTKNNYKKYKSKYIILYKSLCIHCLCKTKIVNVFFNTRVCVDCCNRYSKYHTLCKTYIKKQYYLKDHDLKDLKCIKKRNNLNTRYPITMYLKSDVIQAHLNKYSNFELLTSKIDKINIKNFQRMFKLRMLVNTMRDSHNINMLDYIIYIDYYTDNLYSKYIKNNSNTQKRLTLIINKIIELDFIMTTNINTEMWKDDFDGTLCLFLLSSVTITSSIGTNPYIKNKINKITKEYKHLFIKKRLVIEIGIEWNIKNIFICRYIFSNSININDLKKEMILYNFLTKVNARMTNIDILNISYDKVSYINKFYIRNKDKRHLIPKQLMSLLYY